MTRRAGKKRRQLDGRFLKGRAEATSRAEFCGGRWREKKKSVPLLPRCTTDPLGVEEPWVHTALPEPRPSAAPPSAAEAAELFPLQHDLFSHAHTHTLNHAQARALSHSLCDYPHPRSSQSLPPPPPPPFSTLSISVTERIPSPLPPLPPPFPRTPSPSLSSISLPSTPPYAAVCAHVVRRVRAKPKSARMLRRSALGVGEGALTWLWE